MLAHYVQRVADDLHTNLEQLVGISPNEQRVLRKFGAHFEVESLPLRLREFDGGTQQSFEIHRGHSGWALSGKTEQAGHQRLGAPDVLPDSSRQFELFRVEWRGQKNIGITEHGGDGIVEFVGYAAHQLSDRGQFFRLRDLRLQTFQVGQGLPRVCQQAEQFPVEQVLPGENHDAHQKRRGQRQNQAERTDRRGKYRIHQSPGGKQREREGRNHAQPRQPHAMRCGSGGDTSLRFAVAGPQTDHSDPGHRNSERNVEQTSAVIDMPTERKVGDVRTAGVD